MKSAKRQTGPHAVNPTESGPTLPRASRPLTDGHRRLIQLLALVAVEDFLREGEGVETGGAEQEAQR